MIYKHANGKFADFKRCLFNYITIIIYGGTVNTKIKRKKIFEKESDSFKICDFEILVANSHKYFEDHVV